MRKSLLVSVCLLVAASAFAGVLYQTGDVPADQTVTRLDIDADGDATFVLEVRTALDTDEEREAFEAFAQEVESDPTAAASDFRASVESLVGRARTETGREMSVSNFTAETRVEPLPQERGVVEYSFEWEGFAETEEGGDVLRAGDVLSGYILSEGDALVFRPPDGYGVSSVEPTPDSTDGVVRWGGPRGFADDQPRVVFAPEPTGDAGADTNGTEEGDGVADEGQEPNGTPETGSGSEPGSDGGVPLYAYPVVLVVLLSVAAVAYHARSTEEEEAQAQSGVGGIGGEEGEGERETEQAPEDLSDDERVLGMIESEDGRMKQKNIVEETGWSEAKVSKLTSRLEEEGEITKIRLGRENILEISDEEEEEEDSRGEFGL